MKNSIEIGMTISRNGWSIPKLAQALCLSEFTIKYALQNPSETKIRQKIAETVGVGYAELFGENVNV